MLAQNRHKVSKGKVGRPDSDCDVGRDGGGREGGEKVVQFGELRLDAFRFLDGVPDFGRYALQADGGLGREGRPGGERFVDVGLEERLQDCQVELGARLAQMPKLGDFGVQDVALSRRGGQACAVLKLALRVVGEGMRRLQVGVHPLHGAQDSGVQ